MIVCPYLYRIGQVLVNLLKSLVHTHLFTPAIFTIVYIFAHVNKKGDKQDLHAGIFTSSLHLVILGAD